MLFESHQAPKLDCGLNIYLRCFATGRSANGAANGDYPDGTRINRVPAIICGDKSHAGTGSLIFGPIATAEVPGILGL